MDRATHIQALADALFKGFVAEDGGGHLSRTGNLVSGANLRTQKNRKGWALVRSAMEKCGAKRLWTKSVLKKALAKMLKDRPFLEIPQTSGFSWGQWLKDQVDKIHFLSQRARKNAWRMDHMATVPYDPEDCVHCRLANCIYHCHPLCNVCYTLA